MGVTSVLRVARVAIAPLWLLVVHWLMGIAPLWLLWLLLLVVLRWGRRGVGLVVAPSIGTWWVGCTPILILVGNRSSLRARVVTNSIVVRRMVRRGRSMILTWL